jgi:hypothetical protein
VDVLLYGLEQGPVEKGILEQVRRNRMPIPEKFRSAPELHAGLDLFYIAFMDMSSCRQLGFGAIGPIDWLTINAYCDAHGLRGEQREDMFFFINKMDSAYLSRSTKKPTEPPPKPGRGRR